MELRSGEGLWRVTPGGCVSLHAGPKLRVVCVLPTVTEDPRRAVEGLALEPGEKVEALIELGGLGPCAKRRVGCNEGHLATAALAEHLGLGRDRIHDAWKGRVEVDELTIGPSGHYKGILIGFWFGTAGTILVGARVPLENWWKPRPSFVVGTLEPPRSDKEVKRLQAAGESGAFSAIHTVEIVRDAMGAVEEPWRSRLPDFGVRYSAR